MKTGKNWIFWLGLSLSLLATVYVLTGNYYLVNEDFGWVLNINTSQAVTGFAIFLAGLYLMHSGWNRPENPAGASVLRG